MESLRTETPGLQGKGAYRSRTGVALVTKDSALSPCSEAESVQPSERRRNGEESQTRKGTGLSVVY